MRVYISGPITGQEQDAALRFEQAERAIHKKYKCETMNPERVGRYAAMCARLKHEDFMQLSYTMMDLCDAVYFMDGWENSKGCKMEMDYAVTKPLKIIKV